MARPRDEGSTGERCGAGGLSAGAFARGSGGWARLLPGAALRVLQVGLPSLCFGTFWLADRKRAAAQIFCFVGFVFRQSNLLWFACHCNAKRRARAPVRYPGT